MTIQFSETLEYNPFDNLNDLVSCSVVPEFTGLGVDQNTLFHLPQFSLEVYL